MSRKQLIWIFASITLILAAVVLYQQRTIQSQISGNSSDIKSVRREAQQEIISNIPSGDVMTGDIASGSSNTGTTTQVVITQPNDSTCVISYQALVDRVSVLSSLNSGELTSALNNMTTL